MLSYKDDKVLIVDAETKISNMYWYRAEVIIVLDDYSKKFFIKKNRFGRTGVSDSMFLLKQICFGTSPLSEVLSNFLGEYSNSCFGVLSEYGLKRWFAKPLK